ncbi:Protein kinase [Lobulomyces angularis]|nr:Protein kinase [Lobulomyces angularis]
MTVFNLNTTKKKGYCKYFNNEANSWTLAFLTLTSTNLILFSNELLNTVIFLIDLQKIESIDRTFLKKHCLQITFESNKQALFSFNDEKDTSCWLEEVYHSSNLHISFPTNFVHNVHVEFDPQSNSFIGLPSNWKNSNTFKTKHEIGLDNALNDAQEVINSVQSHLEEQDVVTCFGDAALDIPPPHRPPIVPRPKNTLLSPTPAPTPPVRKVSINFSPPPSPTYTSSNFSSEQLKANSITQADTPISPTHSITARGPSPNNNISQLNYNFLATDQRYFNSSSASVNRPTSPIPGLPKRMPSPQPYLSSRSTSPQPYVSNRSTSPQPNFSNRMNSSQDLNSMQRSYSSRYGEKSKGSISSKRSLNIINTNPHLHLKFS